MNVPIRFLFSDFRKELDCLKKVTARFLENDAGEIVDNAMQQLDQIQTNGGQRKCRFVLAESRPIRTRVGRRYEGTKRKAKLSVYGAASWVWEIRAVDNGRKAPKEFEVTGIASTKIRVFRIDGDDPREIAMWRMELGDLVSPGTYFHTQILGQTDDNPFPHSLSVPRLPSIFVTPMSAVEFMLSELFQDDWSQHATGDSHDLKFWNHFQRKNLTALLNWKLKQLKNNQSSPLVALKNAKPKLKESLFVGREMNS